MFNYSGKIEIKQSILRFDKHPILNDKFLSTAAGSFVTGTSIAMIGIISVSGNHYFCFTSAFMYCSCVLDGYCFSSNNTIIVLSL